MSQTLQISTKCAALALLVVPSAVLMGNNIYQLESFDTIGSFNMILWRSGKYY